MTEAEIREQAIKVLQSRTTLNNLNEWIAHLKDVWEKQNAELLANQKTAEMQCKEDEVQLRTMALSIYSETQNTHPGPGVEIKKFTVLNYDPKEALAWAMDKRMALKLDIKLFENLAKTVEDIPFVEIKEEPRATIVQDLSKALEEINVK